MMILFGEGIFLYFSDDFGGAEDTSHNNYILVSGWFSCLMIQLKVNPFLAMAIIDEAPTTHGLNLVSVGNSLWAQQEIGTQEY